MMEGKVIEKFRASIEKTQSCWIWRGFLDKSGLPIIRSSELRSDGKNHLIDISPRRVSYELAGKVLPPNGKHVQPLICKNKLCVNPAHLVAGDEARFWAKVQRLGDDDCWVWTAALDKDMYGKFCICESGTKIDIRAHQYSWELFTGRSVISCMVVCHKCDHPYCVNPRHLFLGSVQDNNQDAVRKGRNARGETHGQSKLTEEKVKEARQLFTTGEYTKKQIADMYNVSPTTIGNILLGKNWKHVR